MQGPADIARNGCPETIGIAGVRADVHVLPYEHRVVSFSYVRNMMLMCWGKSSCHAYEDDDESRTCQITTVKISTQLNNTYDALSRMRFIFFFLQHHSGVH